RDLIIFQPEFPRIFVGVYSSRCSCRTALPMQPYYVPFCGDVYQRWSDGDRKFFHYRTDCVLRKIFLSVIRSGKPAGSGYRPLHMFIKKVEEVSASGCPRIKCSLYNLLIALNASIYLQQEQ